MRVFVRVSVRVLVRVLVRVRVCACVRLTGVIFVETLSRAGNGKTCLQCGKSHNSRVCHEERLQKACPLTAWQAAMNETVTVTLRYLLPDMAIPIL